MNYVKIKIKGISLLNNNNKTNKFNLKKINLHKINRVIIINKISKIKDIKIHSNKCNSNKVLIINNNLKTFKVIKFKTLTNILTKQLKINHKNYTIIRTNFQVE